MSLSGRKQRTKICSAFSQWWKIIYGVPQGSLLGQLLFNVFMNDLFFFALKCDLCKFADNNTIYSCYKFLSKILTNICFDLNNVLMQFMVNSLKPNSGKFQNTILGKYVTNQVSSFLLMVLKQRNNFYVISRFYVARDNNR